MLYFHFFVCLVDFLFVYTSCFLFYVHCVCVLFHSFVFACLTLKREKRKEYEVGWVGRWGDPRRS